MKGRTFLPVLLLTSIISLLFISSCCEAVVWRSNLQAGNLVATNQLIDFDTIRIGPAFLVFNTTIFTVTSTHQVNMTLTYLRSNMVTIPYASLMIQFDATSTPSTSVTFSISTFPLTYTYAVYKDGVLITSSFNTVTGVLSFTNSGWTTHTFKIYRYTGGVPPPGTPGSSTANTVNNNILGIAIPVIIAAALILVLFAMLATGALTVETFVTWLILFIISMIAIFVIFGIHV